MKKTINYKSGNHIVRIQVSDDGHIYDLNGKEYKQHTYSVDHYRGVSVYCKKIKKSVIVYVHRAVLQAFGPGRRGKHRKYADHIDGDVTNNKIFNLRWVSRKENNSTAIKRLKNSMNAKAVKHEGQVIRGENKLTGEIKYWKTGTQACKDIGCSHVLVYNTLNPSYPLNHAKGWSLQWITILDVDNEKGE